jgi:predicted TIM-barrel fold metal-dependent hydrolase
MRTTYTTEPIAVIDVDSHLTEPADLWVAHAPASLKDRLPRVVENSDGLPRWIIDGKDFGPIAYTAIAPDGGKIHGETGWANWRYSEIHRGSYDFRARLDWLDERGISNQVMFPNIPGFAGVRLFREILDREILNACVTTYNDACAEIQRESGTRLLPLALVPWWDIDLAVAELERLRISLDLRGITMCDSPHLHGVPSLDEPEWDRFWSVAEDLGIAVAFHIDSGDTFMINTWTQSGGAMLATQTPNSFLTNGWIIANLIFSGVLLRHPRLKIFAAETGIGWMPFFLEAMDYQWHENLPDDVRRDVWKAQLPSEIFRQNFFVSFWFERFGPEHMIDVIGQDNVMFETDFPHATALTDRMTEQVAAVIGKLTPDVRRKVLHDNAARLYDLR